MNDKPNFASILDEAPSEVERPKPLPVGTYLCRVQGTPIYDKTTKKGTDFVQFTLKPIAAEEDVDEDDLEAVGGLDNKTLRLKFYLTEDAKFRLDDFHEHCGLDLSEPASRRTRNDEVINSEVRALVKHNPSNDGQTVYAEIARTLKAD